MTAFGITLIVLGSIVAMLNWFTLIATVRGGRFVSAVPLIGAALLGFGLSIVPQTRPYAWMAVIVDYGTLVFLLSLPQLAYAFVSVANFNLLHSLHAHEPGRDIHIKMYRRNIAIVRIDYKPPVPGDDVTAFVVSSSWTARWRMSGDGFSLTDYGSGRELLIAPENGQFRSRESRDSTADTHTHDGLDGLEFKRP